MTYHTDLEASGELDKALRHVSWRLSFLRLLRSVEALNPSDVSVLVQRFAYGHTLTDLARDLGVSREQVRQREVAAIAKVLKVHPTFDMRHTMVPEVSPFDAGT